MSGNFAERTVIVTGAASGLGRAIAEAFAGQGAQVHLFDVDPAALGRAEADLRTLGGTAFGHIVDVRDAAAVQRGVLAVLGQGRGISVLVNNAGVDDREGRLLAELDEETWDRVLDVNLKGAFLMMRAVIPQMVRQGGGAIVNVSSVLSLQPISRDVSYNASKAGMNALTKSGALDYGEQNVRVNAVCPGTIAGGMSYAFFDASPDSADAYRTFQGTHPMRRFGDPQEITAAVLFLASDAASFINGAILSVDGGRAAGLSPHLHG